MKILVYKDNLEAGRGADRAVKAFAAAMSARGHEMVLFDKSRFTETIRSDADVLIVTGTNELVDIAREFPKEFPWPVAMQLHTRPAGIFKKAPFWKLRKRRFNRDLRAAFGRLSLLQVLLPSQIAAARKVLGENAPAKIVAIGNMVGGEQGTGNGEQEFGNSPFIVYPASLEKAKRQDLLIEAFAIAAAKHPQFELHLYGRGKEGYVRELHRLAAKSGVEDKVKLMGYGDLATAYEGCAFAAQTSAGEGFGLTIVEAALCGKPTVGCADASGVNELIVDGETGLLAEPNAQSVAEAICMLMEDEGLVRRLGVAAREKARRDFSPETICRQWEEVLK